MFFFLDVDMLDRFEYLQTSAFYPLWNWAERLFGGLFNCSFGFSLPKAPISPFTHSCLFLPFSDLCTCHRLETAFLEVSEDCIGFLRLLYFHPTLTLSRRKRCGKQTNIRLAHKLVVSPKDKGTLGCQGCPPTSRPPSTLGLLL